MSRGSFVSSRYENGLNGDIHFIKIQPETLTLQIGNTTNTAPTGAINNQKRAFVSSRRRRGAVCARKVGLRVTDAGETDFNEGSILYVPVLRPAALAAMLDPEGQTGTYDGATVEVIGSSGERINQ